MEWISEIGVAFLCLICAGVFFASVSFFYHAGLKAGEEIRAEQIAQIRQQVCDQIFEQVLDRFLNEAWTHQERNGTQCRDIFRIEAEAELNGAKTANGT